MWSLADPSNAKYILILVNSSVRQYSLWCLTWVLGDISGSALALWVSEISKNKYNSQKEK